MAHDSNKVMLGTTSRSGKLVTSKFAEDPATFPAGTALRMNAGALSKSTGSLYGISLGTGLVNGVKQVAICEIGEGVPVLVDPADIKASKTIQDLTYTAKDAGVAGDEITINYNTGGSDGDATVSVADKAISVVIEDGVTTAETIANAIAAKAEAAALVTVAIASGKENEPQDVFGDAVALEGGGDAGFFIVEGEIMKIDSNGRAAESGTDTAAVYRSLVLSGIAEDGSAVPCVLVDIVGGL